MWLTEIQSLPKPELCSDFIDFTLFVSNKYSLTRGNEYVLRDRGNYGVIYIFFNKFKFEYK